jgi:transposase-like protein
MTHRKQYSAEYKSTMALTAIQGDGTVAELSQKYEIHANTIVKWKREALDGMKETFARKGKKDFSQEANIKTLQAKIGELVVKQHLKTPQSGSRQMAHYSRWFQTPILLGRVSSHRRQ